MRIAIPVSQSDVNLFRKQVEVLYKFGGLENHTVTVFPTPSVTGQIGEIVEGISQLSRKFDVIPIDIEPEGGWPHACNQHFAGVIQKLYEIGNTESVLWLEPDSLPSKYGWANIWVARYNQMGKPYMGHLRDTAEVTSPPQDGKHMVGVGMYPADFYNRTRLWSYVRGDQPFDIWCRWEIAPKCYDTDLIQHIPKSSGFKFVEGKLVGVSEEVKGHPKDVTIDPTSIILHGCKDDSLANALLKEGEIHNSEFHATINLPEPPIEITKNPVFQAVKSAIREWSISVPGAYEGDRRVGDQHIAVIVDAVYNSTPPPNEGFVIKNDPLVIYDKEDGPEVYKEVVAIDGKQRRINARAKIAKTTGHLIG